MSKRTIALITSLVLLTVILFVIAFTTQNQRSASNTGNQAPTTALDPVADSMLSLSPDTVTFSASSNATVAIMVDSGVNEINGVQVELAYDPAVIRNVVITPGDFFADGLVLINSVDQKNGRISYVISLPPQSDNKKGAGTVANISFSKGAATTQTQTDLTFLPKTYVTTSGSNKSLLRSSLGATIILSGSTNSQPSQSTGSAQPTQ